MARKLSELTQSERIYFENIMNFMNETWNDDIRQRLKIARKYNLDLNDEDVIELVTPKDIHQTIPTENSFAVTTQPKRATRIYGENWIVVQNRLLYAISHLNLNERRLIMFLSPLVRKAVDVEPTQRVFTVKVKEFQAGYDIKGNYLYKELTEVADSILNKAFFFWYGGKKGKSKKGVSWVSECDYIENEGALEIKLDDTVIEMLTIFDKNNPFTKYQREMIVNLGVYGIILFELIASCMHQNFKQKAYTIEYLREKFNCTENYLLLADFKRYVIDTAIKDIEKHTPYRIKYSQKKKGRTVSEIVFSFEDLSEKVLRDEMPETTKLEQPVEVEVLISRLKSKNSELTIEQKEVITASANEYISRRKITEEKHITNIYKIALKEKWGLEGSNEKVSDLNAQNAKVLAQIERDKQGKLIEEEKLAHEKAINKEFESCFEDLSSEEKFDIIERVRLEVKKIPGLIDSFDKDKENAYKDIMFRAKFKEIMNFKSKKAPK